MVESFKSGYALGLIVEKVGKIIEVELESSPELLGGAITNG